MTDRNPHQEWLARQTADTSGTDRFAEREDLIRRLAYALDVAMPELVRQARSERESYLGHGLREITRQDRLAMARGALREASDLLGVPLGDDE